MENNNSTKEKEDGLNDIPSLIIKYAEKYFGKEKWSEIISGKFNFDSHKKVAVDMERAKLHCEMLKTSSLEQYKNLASISALSATLLVIATFNDRILPYSIWVKILLTILLVAIIISLWAYYKNFSDAAKKSFDELAKITEQYEDKESVLRMEEINKKAKRRLLNYAPMIVNILVIFAIIGIIILIWI